MKFEVIRQHYGDKLYMPGDMRDATENDVKHLVSSGVLKPARERKAEAEPRNKMDTEPKNKAEDAADTKSARRAKAD